MWDDPRRVLGVEPTASLADVRRAYRQLARQYHPDAGGNAEQFKQIHAAYIRLISASKPPSLAGEEGERLRVVYGIRSYAPGYLVWRRLLRPKIVWTRGRVRLAVPLVLAVALPAIGWSINPTATVLCGAGLVVSGQIRINGF